MAAQNTDQTQNTAPEETKNVPDIEKLVEEKVQATMQKKTAELEGTYEEKFKAAISTEKKKLYETLALKESKIKELEETLQLKKAEAARGDTVTKDDVKEAKELELRLSELQKQQKATEDRFAEILALQEEKFKATESSFKKELEDRDLAVYKANKLLNANEGILPELVTGKTREEIDASFELAKARFLEIEESIKKKLSKELVDKGHIPETRKPLITVQQKDLLKMSREDFQKYKEEVLAKEGL